MQIEVVLISRFSTFIQPALSYIISSYLNCMLCLLSVRKADPSGHAD